jgi:hypothetical protein
MAAIFEFVMQILGLAGAGEEATGIVGQVFDAILALFAA